jgi:hypothetical protein
MTKRSTSRKTPSGNPLADARRREAEAAAFDGEQLWRAGRLPAARARFAEAAAIEEAVARDSKRPLPRALAAVAVGAVALWHRAGEFERAKSAAYAFLARGNDLTPDGRQDLERLVERCSRELELAKLSGDAAMTPVEIKLDGGRVGRGVVPEGEARRRREVFGSLLMRAAELEAGMPHRDRGESKLGREDAVQIFEVPAIAASFGVRFYVATGTQQKIASERPVDPERVVARFLQVAQLAACGSSFLRQEIADPLYAQSFIDGFAEIAPDGEEVGTVACYAPSWRLQSPPLVFDRKHREELRAASSAPFLREPAVGEQVFDGLLTHVFLTRDDAWVRLDDAEQIYILKDKRMRQKAAALRADDSDTRVRLYARFSQKARRHVVADIVPFRRAAIDRWT